MNSIFGNIKIIVASVALMACTAAPLYAEDKTEFEPFVLVLDAGHGGRDIGCRGTKTREKDVTLDVVKRVDRLVDEAFGDSVTTILTREDDTFVPLDKRADIANKAGAKLFVSVHVNSVDRRSKGRNLVHGASVYTLGLHKSDANLSVAMRENGVIELEEDFSETYQGFDPNSSESYIIFELTQNTYLARSIEMASLVQGELTEHAGRADKGVRQAGFLVLWATKMPSVLVELDFICNREAENFLASSEGRQKCAEAIFNAFKIYRQRHSSPANNNN